MSAITLRFRKGCLREDLDAHERPLFDRLLAENILQKGNDGLYRLASLYRIGRLSINQEGFGFVEAQEATQQDLLIRPSDLNGAKHGDIVLVKRIIARRGRASAKVIEIVERARLFLLAYLHKEAKESYWIDLKTARPVTVKMQQTSPSILEVGTVVKVDIETDEIEEIVGNLNDPKIDETISLALYKRRDAFPPSCIEEAKGINTEVSDAQIAKRRDLRALDFCTIDPVSAKDFDDAIYFDLKTHTLYVAIADVSHYVPYFSEIDKEAKLRGFTTYLPHKAFPMLPRVLSEGICSLKPRVDRLAFVAEIRLDPDTLQPLEERFYEAVIHSKHRFNYDEVDAILAEGYKGNNEEVRRILAWLLPLQKITQRLRKARLQHGFDFRNDETRIVLDAAHRLVDTRIETGTPSHSLIEECMLLANQAAAKRFSGEGDAIFRIHEAPEISKLESLLSELATVGLYVDDYESAEELICAIQKQARAMGIEKEVDAHIIKSLKQASYSAYNVGHFGLGFSHYSHFTSPIRRYSDLILHRLIKAQLRKDDEELRYLLRNMEPLCAQVSTLEREATKAEWDFRDRKFARWAAEHLGEIFTAEISEIDEEGKASAVLTDDNAPSGVVVQLKADILLLFDTIKIRLSASDIATATITGEFVEKT